MLGSADDVSFSGITGRPARITRIADALGRARWLVESQPDALGRHLGFCESETTVRGKIRVSYTGVYDVPFSFEVIQKP